MWDLAFTLTNAIALVMWLALIALPRHAALLAAVLYFGVGLLCLAYASLFLGLFSGFAGPANEGAWLTEYSVEGLKALFASDAWIVIGWTHYLAFDLFVGLWIARDADAKGFSRLAQVPVLLATFLVGPIGLLAWFAIREKRARASGRWQ